MRKLIIFGLLSCCTIFSLSLDAAPRIRDIRDLDTNCDGCYDPCEVGPCDEYQTGPCVAYCPVTRFKPQYYCVNTYVDEPYCVQKKCTRYVPQYYTKQFCRYVPQYYNQTYCRKVPECYYVTENKCRKKCVQEQKCRYIPYTVCEKKVFDCMDDCQQAYSGGGGCSGGSCSTGNQYAMPSGRDYYQQDSQRNGYQYQDNQQRNGANKFQNNVNPQNNQNKNVR